MNWVLQFWRDNINNNNNALTAYRPYGSASYVIGKNGMREKSPLYWSHGLINLWLGILRFSSTKFCAVKISHMPHGTDRSSCQNEPSFITQRQNVSSLPFLFSDLKRHYRTFYHFTAFTLQIYTPKSIQIYLFGQSPLRGGDLSGPRIHFVGFDW